MTNKRIKYREHVVKSGDKEVTETTIMVMLHALQFVKRDALGRPTENLGRTEDILKIHRIKTLLAEADAAEQKPEFIEMHPEDYKFFMERMRNCEWAATSDFLVQVIEDIQTPIENKAE